MVRLLKVLFFLAIVAVFAVIGYAYLGDLSPSQDLVIEPVELEAN